MEAVSEKRGRPRRYNPDACRQLAGIWGSRSRTPRQHQTYAMMQIAAGCLRQDHEFVAGVEHIIGDDPLVLRIGVLEQLGRLKSEINIADSEIIILAREVSANFASDPTMTVRKAVAIIRKMRQAAASLAACRSE